MNHLVKKCKEEYRNKVQKGFETNSTRNAWKGLQTITGCSKQISASASQENAQDQSNKLNIFYSRFEDSTNMTTHIDISKPGENGVMPVSETNIRNSLKRLNTNKAAGPEIISSRLLKLCANELCYIICVLFNISLKTRTVPALWKTANIVPVPNKRNPSQ